MYDIAIIGAGIAIAIIGAGIAGSYIARELSRYQLDVVLLDGENDVGNQITMANSAIVHGGFDAPSETRLQWPTQPSFTVVLMHHPIN